MTDPIRWEPNGFGGYLGYAGTLDVWLFQIYRAAPESPFVLLGTLPGHSGALAQRTDAGLLKAKAGELLRAWAASIGAVFPGPVIPLTADGTTRAGYIEGAAAERARCAALARSCEAVYQDENGDTRPFADLIGGE